MTSLERRRETRYQRRKAKRIEKKQARCAKYDDYERIISYHSLFQANRTSKKNVSWKASVQRYQINLLRNLHSTHNALKDRQDISRGFVEFNQIERGKLRHIRSVHYSERVVQRSACDKSLTPMLSRNLIYDNGACLKGKGVDWSLNRLDAHLQQFYRANGFSNEGYAVIFDFSGYFDNILHSVCREIYGRTFDDKNILWMLDTFITPFGYPQINGNWRKSPKQTSLAEYDGKSLGLGSQVSQITAISYPNSLDHYIKQVLHVKWYGRYMDDGYMLFRTKQEANAAADAVIAFCRERLGITVNRRKTNLYKLGHWFPYLKVKHRIGETGKAERHISRSSITRERRKLKKFAVWFREGKMPLADIRQAYGSWKGYALHRNAWRSIQNMDRLYTALFGERPPVCKLKKSRRK